MTGAIEDTNARARASSLAQSSGASPRDRSLGEVAGKSILPHEGNYRPAGLPLIGPASPLIQRPQPFIGAIGGIAFAARLQWSADDAPTELLHLVGYVTGAALYAMLLAMVVRRSPVDRLALSTAGLGCVWNIGELTALGLTGLGLASSARRAHTASYAALGFLGAVVVQSVTRSVADAGIAATRRTVARLVAVVGHGSAAIAAFMHVAAAASGDVLPSSTGLVVVTAGLGSMVLP